MKTTFKIASVNLDATLFPMNYYQSNTSKKFAVRKSRIKYSNFRLKIMGINLCIVSETIEGYICRVIK